MIAPSYSQGFARYAAQSVYPELWRGLVALFAPRLGATGQMLYDSSLWKNHGTFYGSGDRWLPGSAHLNGSDDYIRMLGTSTVPELSIFPEQTISVWVRVHNHKYYNGILSKWAGTNAPRQFATIVDATGRVGYYISADDSTNVSKWTSAAWVTANQWTHLAFTWIPSVSMTIYVNGVLAQTFTTSVPASIDPTTTMDFVIGIWGGNLTNYSDGIYEFDGEISEACIWNRVLRPNEIASMAAGASPLVLKRRVFGFVSAAPEYRHKMMMVI